jgi:hypothetical protein
VRRLKTLADKPPVPPANLSRFGKGLGTQFAPFCGQH